MGLREKYQKNNSATKIESSNHHPLRAELIERSIPQTAVARYCKVGKQLFFAYLVGKIKMPKRVEGKIEKFIIQIDEEEGR